jgi:hypothetical protein
VHLERLSVLVLCLVHTGNVVEGGGHARVAVATIDTGYAYTATLRS